MIFDHLFSRKFLESKSFEYFLYEYRDVLVLDLPNLREVELVRVWTVHTLFEYAHFSLLANQFVTSIHKYYFRQDPLWIRVPGSRILLLRAIVPLFLQKWSWSDSCLTLGSICAFVTSSKRVSPYLLKNWLCTLKQAFSLWLISLQQALRCFSLLKVQWRSQRIPGVLVVDLSLWVLRVVVANDVDCLTFEPWKNEVTCSKSSVNFLLVSSSTFNTWLFCNSSMSRIFLIQVSRRSRFCSDISSCNSNWSRLDCWHTVIV